MQISPRLMGISLCMAAVAASAGAAEGTRVRVSPPAPAPVAAPAPAAAATLNAAGEGRRLWLKLNCYSCHGDRAAGGMGPNVQHAEAGDIGEVVRQGGEGGMPSYRSQNLSSTDISNLGAYLRSIGSASEPKFRDWWVAIPPK